MTDSFARFSLWVLRRRWAVLAVWAVLLAVAGGLLQPRASSVVKGADSAVPGSGSDKASAVLARDFHASSTHTVAVIFRSRTMTVDNPSYRRQVVEAARKIAAIQGVRSVVTYYDTGNPSLVSRDRHATLASIALAGSDEQATKMVPTIRAPLRGLTIEHYAIGTPALIKDTLTTSETDLHRSELFTIPIVLILLLLVFRTVVAAAIPLVLGMCSVALSLGLIAIIGSYVDTSVFALNISSMMGLGLGIDFSLIVVGRFREELAAGRSSWDAVAATMATAGRSIAYSGVTVILAMVIMTAFMHDIVIIRSISMAVILVAITALLAGLTVLPVLLGLLGHRIELLRVVPRSAPAQSGARWYRW